MSLRVLKLVDFLSYDGSNITFLRVCGDSICLIILVSCLFPHLEHRNLRLTIVLIALVFPVARVLPSRMIGAPLISRLKGKIVCLLLHSLVNVKVHFGANKLSF